MAWNPTHVQLTVLRARNLVGKLKGKTSAKVSDVFVRISLGKEKFQTSTIKYGCQLKKQVEWFEECDLSIPSLCMDVEVHLMNRGLLSDEFIGYVAIPLSQYRVFERPQSQWLQLQQRPTKTPDNRSRGELEVRLTFHVKSRTESIIGSSPNDRRTSSIKSLVIGFGDKFKFTRSRSLRGEGRRDYSLPGSSVSGHSKSSKGKTSNKPATYKGDIEPTSNVVSFDAVDLYVPDNCWRENPDPDNKYLGDGDFSRSYSLTKDRRRAERDFKSRSLINLPTEYSMTLPNPRRNKNRISLDEAAMARPPRSSVTSQEGYLDEMFRSEREIDNRMHRTCDEDIVEEDTEIEYFQPRRSLAREFSKDIPGNSNSSSSSESESGSESESEADRVSLPKVKLKEDQDSNLSYSSGELCSAKLVNHHDKRGSKELLDSNENIENRLQNFRKNSTKTLQIDCQHNRNSLDSSPKQRINLNNVTRSSTDSSATPEYSDLEDSNTGTVINRYDGPNTPSQFNLENTGSLTSEEKQYSDAINRLICPGAVENGRLEPHNSCEHMSSSVTSSGSSSYDDHRNATQRAIDRGSPESVDLSKKSRTRISPEESFNFTSVSQIGNEPENVQQKRVSKRYTQGGRRYTVQGMEGVNRHSVPDVRSSILGQRPHLTHANSIPEDLMAVYRNMNREELIRLVVTHKAQLIRKDQYICDLEKYIDQLLVRVMESTPKLLQTL